MRRFNLLICILVVCLAIPAQAFDPSGLLEIHYINVQTGGCVLVIGPDGTTILMDGGENGNGYSDIIPYLQSIGLTSTDDLDYMIAGHLHSDHIGGLDEVIYGGYDVTEAVYYSGSSYWNSMVEDFFNAAATTTAGGPDAIALNTVISLGDSAEAICVAANGYVLGHGYVGGSNENDKSIAMLITYGEFEYIFASDLSGGDDDEWCTGRHTATDYANVETPLSNSLVSPSGANLLGADGLEVLHVNHHGSESSTNSDYMNNLSPSVACINVGWGQPDGWDFPRHDVLDNVLLADASACVNADPAMVFQTEEGSGSPDSYRSYNGYCVGDIIIKTNGQMLFRVFGTGRINGGPDERSSAGLPRYFPLDEDSDDITSPESVTDLGTSTGPGDGEVTLTWTAPGDDGASGTAAIYEIRYRLSIYGPIASQYAWNMSTPVENPPSPQPGGTSESFTVTGLDDGESYYFSIKAMDDNLNLSGLSNSPLGIAGDTGNQPPTFGTIDRYPPSVVYPENSVAVRAEIIDDGTILKDSLYYQMSTLLIYTAVGHDSIGTDNSDYCWYTIPAGAAGTLVEYYVIAEDDIAQRVESSILNYTVSEHPDNQLINGDFELWTINGPDGPPDNWTKDTGGFTASREQTITHSGNYSANLTWTSTSTQILNADTIAVVAGVAYICSVYVYDNDPGGRFRLCFISDGDNSYPENYSTDLAEWQHLGYTWVASPAATWVIVQLRMYDVSAYWDGSATVYADDVAFTDTTSQAGDYAYLPGDANMLNGAWPPAVIGGDVTYLVSYFRGLNQPCLLDGFWASADANGDCTVIGSDVTRLVNYFRSITDLSYCPDFTPLWLIPDDCPVEAPEGWPNCEDPGITGK